jgi:single stranded DNA-binding protein (ssb)
MNNVSLIGNIGQNLKIVELEDKKKYIYFSVAVSNGKSTNWINCAAWGSTAEFIFKYFGKGSKIGITGRLRSSTYTKDDTKAYSMQVVVQSVSFAGSKKPDGEELIINDGFEEVDEANFRDFNDIDFD